MNQSNNIKYKAMNIKYIHIIVIFSFLSLNINAQSRNYTSDTLSMGPGYANDLFYSMSNGLISSEPRSGWELAFYTNAFSAGIIINEGVGVELYTYPNGDTSNWTSIDTTGISNWKRISNSPEYWEDGAFNRNALGHPDYGWGVYNMVTHGVTGDSLYIINVPALGMKKLWIVNKMSVDNIYNIKFADLDGSNEEVVALDIKPFADKNFAYYSMETNELKDREPAEEWDILFTKYIDLTYDNEGNPVEYLVTGATSNVDRYASKYNSVSDDYEDWSAKPFDSLKNVIGYNWKSFDMGIFQWTIEDSTAFFVMNDADDVYKLVFTFWEGSGSGVFGLSKELISVSFLNDELESSTSLELYPNPATDWVNIKLDTDVSQEGELVITDISGRVVYKETVRYNSNANVRVETANLTKGLYLVIFNSSEHRKSAKFIVR